ncbi:MULTISPECIES: SRPBCC family protein [unclassified Streptomyces]|uniref:SRPBCC family protein n=1 Tax=unclassified Streptomyces TaxID=2593676 RepID=UPI00332D866A
MIEVTRVVTLRHPLADVVRYLSDFSHTEMWDPGTVTCEQIGSAPVAVGTEWHNVSQFRGRRTELDYTLTRFEEDHLTFVGRNKTATSTDDLRFEEHTDGTRLTYRARVDFHGLARIATPLLKREFERLGDEVSERLPQALDEALSSPPRSDSPQ